MQTPASPAEISADWLTAALRAHGGGRGGRVRSCEAEPLGGEQGITGPLARLRLKFQEPGPGLPRTLMAKFSVTDPAHRAMLATLGHYEREVRFYERLADRTAIPTPHCYYSQLDPETGAAILLLEDLAPARNGSSIAGCSVDEVARVLIRLATMHARWWESPELADASWLELRFLVAPQAMAGAFDHGWPSFLGKLGIPVTAEIIEMGEWIGQHLPRAVTLFESGPRTLVHNDVQADNLFFTDADPAGRGDVIVIDWQMATYARCVIDVAGWVRGQLEQDIRRGVEDDLLRLYHDVLLANGVPDYPFDRCRADYQLAAVLAPARLACAVGMTEGLQPHPGAFWDTLLPRYPD